MRCARLCSVRVCAEPRRENIETLEVLLHVGVDKHSQPIIAMYLDPTREAEGGVGGGGRRGGVANSTDGERRLSVTIDGNDVDEDRDDVEQSAGGRMTNIPEQLDYHRRLYHWFGHHHHPCVAHPTPTHPTARS